MKRSRVHLSRLGVVALAVVLAATGCASGDDGSTGTTNGSGGGDASFAGFVGDQQPGDPVQGGVLTVADYTEARSLNPTQTIANGAAGGNALAAVYDVLVRYDFESEEFVPQLAESLEPNDDSSVWTLTLREGVNFSDGTPLDADAVVGSYEYYTGNRGSDTGLLMTNVASVTAEDERTVVYTLRGPWTSFDAMLGQGVGLVVAPAAIAGEEFTPIGAGPFVFENYAPSESLTLTANEDYWAGRPNLDGLRFVWLNTDQPKVDGLRSGSVHTAMLRDAELIEELREAEQPGYMHLTNGGLVFMLNHREGQPAADVRVRQAIALATRPEVVYERAYGGAGMPGKALFTEDSRWHDEDVEPQGTDDEQARTLLEEAKADGFDGTISLLNSGTPNGRAESLALKAMLDGVGFETELEYAGSVGEQIQRTYVDNDFEMVRVAASISDENPHKQLYTTLHSQSFTNAGGYANPEMDAAIGSLQTAADDDERAAAIAEVERIWAEDVPSVSVGAAAVYLVWDENVHGISPTVEQMQLFDKAWIAE